MNAQNRENLEPHEENNPIPISITALVLALSIWGIGYIFWTHSLSAEASSTQNQILAANVAGDSKELPRKNGSVDSKASSNEIVQTKVAQNKLAQSKSTASINGKQIYDSKCAACHQGGGTGIPGAFPPLKGSKWVTDKNVDVPIQIVANGLSGEITVDGHKYNGMMPAFAASIKPQEMAALVTYIRTSWGNTGSEVTTQDIEKSNKQYQGRSKPWTEAELSKMLAN